MKQKLIVISADGLVGEDVAAMESMPGFSRYFKDCARAESMRSIYPSITYPCHTTMCTGVYPDKHKVFYNLEFRPGEEKIPWRWFRKYNQWDEDIFKAAKREGLTTASIFWPVTGCHPDIDWLIAEYWPQSPEQTNLECFEESGSSPEVLGVIKRHMDGLKIQTHPSTDDFMVDCACDFIREFAPDLMMIHPGNVDGYRHHCDVFCQQSYQGVKEIDRYIGQIMDTLAETGLAACTNVVLTSDHGLIDWNRCVQVDQLLARYGLLKITDDGKLDSWDAWCVSGGLCAMVYINPDAPKDTWERTYSALKELRDSGDWGIEEVYTQEETQKMEHFGGDFAFVLEGDGHTSFGHSLTMPVVEHSCGNANHGHYPDKGPQPVFLGVGPAFRKNVVAPRARLVDGAPTYAKILGLHLRGADGVPMDELLSL